MTVECDWCHQATEQDAVRVRRNVHHFCCNKCKGAWNSVHRRGPASSQYQGKAVCPKCGGHKSWVAKTCYKCEPPRYNMMGPLSPKWNPNLTDEERAQRRRHTAASQTWAKAVWKRDKHACQLCDAKSVRVYAHHIVYWREDRNLRFVVANGITLCGPCHKWMHHTAKKVPYGL